MAVAGTIVVLNGSPRSGKSSIATALMDDRPGMWVNLGADSSIRSLPERLRPGIGLRPGGERPDLEDLAVALYAALYESIAAHSRLGVNVAVDVAHHESYSRPRHILRDCARRVAGLPVLFVGVRCPVEDIWRRRAETWGQGADLADPEVVAAVRRWQEEVHVHGPYDVEVDTSVLGPGQCAAEITARLAAGSGRAFERLATR